MQQKYHHWDWRRAKSNLQIPVQELFPASRAQRLNIASRVSEADSCEHWEGHEALQVASDAIYNVESWSPNSVLEDRSALLNTEENAW